MACNFFMRLAPMGPHSFFIPALPTLLEDIIDSADKWGNDGKSGRIDPFTELYNVSPFL